MLTKLKPRSEFSRNVLTLMTGTTIAQAIPIVISPILTRIYSPEDFGVFAIFISIVGIMAVISTGKYELSIILPKLNNYAFQLLALSLLITFFMSLFYLFSLFSISLYFSFDIIYFLLPLTVFFIGINNTFDKYNNRIKNYKLMSYQRLIKTTVESLIGISFMMLFSVKSGLIWGFICGYFVSSFAMLYINYNSFKEKKFIPSLNKIKVLGKRYINFPKYNMPHALLNTFSSNAPVFLIPIFYTTSTLGLYAFGLKIVQAPLGLLSASIFSVLGQKMAEEHANGKEIKSIFLKNLSKLILLAMTLMPIFLFIDDIFAFIFGEQWRVAGSYVQILSPWLLLTFIISPFAAIPHIYHQQKKAFILEIVYSLARILPFLIGAGFFDLSLENVLMIYTAFGSLVLAFGLYWYYSLIIKGLE